MLIFGYAGVTLGASILAVGIARAVRRASTLGDGGNELASLSSYSGYVVGRWLDRVLSWLTVLGKTLDIRFILVGSLLPDIIDKPLGMELLREALSNGRIFSRTLLFFILTGASGLFVYRRFSKTWPLALALGTSAHLALDSMWQMPRTLLWPAYGLAFEKMDLGNWMQGLWHRLVTNPAAYVSEIIGVIVIAWFLWNLLRQGKIRIFMRRGQIH